MGWLLFYAEFEWWGERYKPYEEVNAHLYVWAETKEGLADILYANTFFFLPADCAESCQPFRRHGSRETIREAQGRPALALGR